ncbi:MAG: T9SS type A sorting domain-containing protein [Cyclobacteriaceae bacterium]|nr:T9SS type A sorting domain-containing protein [Cyclobacteriaceae bacterium]
MIKLLLGLILFLPLGLSAQFTYVLDQSIPVGDINKNELRMPWAGGLNAAHYNTMDLNADGKDDLVLFDRTAGKILTFLNQENQYEYAPAFESFFPEGITNWLLLRDFNCDGKKDIFTGDILGIKVYANETGPGENLSWKQFLFYSGFGGEKSPVLLTTGFSGKINLQLQFDDLPSIIDADGDGDLDIFNVRFAGNGTVEYHQNFSMERYGTCDSLDFERQTQKWGDFTECECGEFAFNGSDCPPDTGGRTQHAGGKSLLAIDVDGDARLDLLFSEASCSNLYLLRNEGTLIDPKINTSSNYPPNNPVDFAIFPAAFYEDLDFDGTKDLIAIPNIFSNTLLTSKLEQSNWFYTNGGSNAGPALTFSKPNFLQENMIDLGDNSVPAFNDYDADGDYDLFISQRTYENSSARIVLYENTGTASSPEFTLIDNDMWEFSQTSFYNLKIQFADINSDSRIDLVFTATSFETGKTNLYYLANKGNSQLDFTNQSVQSANFSISASENILVTDVNKDGLPDLLVGKTNGSLAYWKNNGPAGILNFSLENESFLELRATVLRQNIACTVSDLDADGKADLVYGDQSGHLSIISNFRDAVDATGAITDITFNALLGSYESRNLGGPVWPTAVNLFNAAQPAIVIGNVLGGISILRNDEGESLPKMPVIDVYPNPSSKDGFLNIKIDRPAYFQVFSVLGKQLTEPEYLAANEEYTNKVPTLSAGVYFLRFTTNAKSFVKRIVIY